VKIGDKFLVLDNSRYMSIGEICVITEIKYNRIFYRYEGFSKPIGECAQLVGTFKKETIPLTKLVEALI
jgi:hypothetical protein